MNSLINLIDKLVSGRRNVLELGCGNGKLLNEIAIKFPHLEKIVGVDFFNKPQSIEGKIQFIKQDLENINLTGSYDLIILNHVLEHIKNPLGLIEKLKLLLAERGKILIVVPNRNGFGNEARVYLPEHGKHYFLWDKESLRYSLERLGFVCRLHNLYMAESKGGILKYVPALLGLENPNLTLIAAIDCK